jgi:sorbitol/mannitol transport system substrate-binding protein
VAKENGWVSVPPGTRESTYDNPDYQKAAPFASFVHKAISVANPNGQTEQPRPYTGAQFVAIPEFQGIGTQVGQTIAGTLTGQTTVDQALRAAQSATERTMHQSGYPK